MKRSEMIEIMVRESLIELKGHNMTDPYFPYEVAKVMLDAAEKAGMLPPMAYTKKYKEAVSNLILPEGYIKSMGSWEPEE